MVVQHNLIAMNSNRMMNMVVKKQGKSTEKLSSGYKINRAADDAAGLSISEKMRKQIRGLTQASSNAQDGISCVQTAEGALNEVQDMLQRMNELAVKAANGTNSDDDRSYIQSEVDQLVKEIDRVAETTKFNETYLLKGDGSDAVEEQEQTIGLQTTTFIWAGSASVSGNSCGISFNGNGNFSENVINEALKDICGKKLKWDVTHDTDGKWIINNLTMDGYTFEFKEYGTDYPGNPAKSSHYDVKNASGDLLFSLNGTVTFSTTAVEGTYELAPDGYSPRSNIGVSTFYDATGNVIPESDLSDYVFFDGEDYKLKSGKLLYDVCGTPYDFKLDTPLGKVVFNSRFTHTGDTEGDLAVNSLKLSLHVGADSSLDNKITLVIDPMNAKSLGIKGIRVDGDDDKNATEAIDKVAAAIQKVSAQRSSLGAIQNRLEHTIANLDNVVENTTAAEAAIRDTDMATEMVRYSNNNILAQAGQAMLAQANQTNQGVLSLLQG